MRSSIMHPTSDPEKTVQIFTMVAGITIKGLCSTLVAPLTSPICDVYRTVCPGSAVICSNSMAVMSRMCTTDFVSSPGCEEVIKSCVGNAECAVQDKLLDAIVSQKDASALIAETCDEMPDMKDCKSCPAPSSDGISNCALLDTYAKLCIDMPRMHECKKFNAFCLNMPSSNPICKTGVPAASQTPDSTPQTPMNTTVVSLENPTAPNSLLILALMAVF